MRKSTKAMGLIFLAAASVYSSQVIGAAPARPGRQAESSNTDVKLLEDPEQLAGAPSTQPSTQPSEPAPPPSMLSNIDGTFSLNITSGADLVETLRVIGFQAQKSVLPSKDVHSTLPALDLYNVTVTEALDAILKINGFVWKEQGNFIYIYSAKEWAEQEKANRVMNTEVFRVYYTPASNALNLIKPLLSSDGGEAAITTPPMTGVSSGSGDVGGNSHATEDMLVVTDYIENLDKIRNLLKEIDRRPQQILIEATILRAALTDDNALGIDFNIVGGVDFSSLTSSNGQITNANIQSGVSPQDGNIHSVGTGNNFSNSVGNGLKVGFVSNNVSMFLSALEGVTDTEVLANPKVLALNKQKGEVIVGRKDGYLTTTQTETSTVQTVEFLDTGTRLIFRPFIGDDGYIRMEIHPEDSSGGLANNLPFKITTEVTSNVMVKDGRTIVIGGLFREANTRSRNQIPGLGNLPGVGPLFRQQRDLSTREEIIILLTPHIVKDDIAYSDASEEMLKMFDQVRVGVRKGMMWWGRERLAESAYESAVAEMNKENPSHGRALWHLDSAMNLSPTMTEAANMRRDLMGHEVASADNSMIHNFVRRQILAERRRAAASADSIELSEYASEYSLDSSSPATQPSDSSSMMAQRYSSESPVVAPTASSSLQNVEELFKPEMFSLDLNSPTTAPSSQPALAQVDVSEHPGQVQQKHQVEADGWGMSTVWGGMRGMLWLRGMQQQEQQQIDLMNSTSVTELSTEEAAGSGSGGQNK